MKDIKQDLIDRMALLRVRYEVAFTDFVARPEFEARAAVIEEGLHQGLDSAVRMAQAIVDPAELDGTAFWATPLGVLLFAAGGYPRGQVPQPVVTCVLHCSRQYVHELIGKGKLTVVPQPVGSVTMRLVDAEGVKALVKKKLDKLVNQTV